jgi:type IV secretion system protein VirD4
MVKMTTTTNPTTLYQIPQAERDPARFFWWSGFLFIFIALLAGDRVCRFDFEYQVCCKFFDIFLWLYRYDKPDYGVEVVSVFNRARILLEIGALIAMAVPVVLVYRKKGRIMGQRNDLYGSAHFATPAEIQATGLLPDEKTGAAWSLGPGMTASKPSISGIWGRST